MSVTKKCSGDELYAFQTIQDFINSLYDFFGSKCHSLSLYQRLLSKMTFQESDLIERHLKTFRNFCIANRTGLTQKDITAFTQTKISFSDRIYIDLDYVFRQSDDDTHKVVWEYLLLISALLDPENKTKELLKDLKKNQGVDGEFLGDMMSTISSQLGSNPSGNPMEMIGSMLNSDVLGTLTSSLQSNLESGQLDLGKLMGTMQGLVQKVGDEVGKSEDPMIKNLFAMLEQTMPNVKPPVIQDETQE